MVALDGLPFKEHHIILDHCGLKRYLDWFIEIEPIDDEVIAARYHLGKQQSVDYLFRRSIKKLRSELIEAGWI